MAFNPSPAVQVARDAAQRLGNAGQCIVIAVNYTENTIQCVTYGKTRVLCDDAKRLGDVAYEAVVDALKRRA